MGLVETLGELAAELQEAGPDDPQAHLLQTAYDPPHQTPLHGIRLQDDQCGFHGHGTPKDTRPVVLLTFSIHVATAGADSMGRPVHPPPI